MRVAAPFLALIVIAGCADERRDPLKPPEPAASATEKTLPDQGSSVTISPDTGSAPEIKTTESDARFAAAQQAPHIYMALQPDPSGPTSVVFAIDESRDATPTDDPAIRITPEDGACNPQELRRYNFPDDATQRPVFGPDEVLSGLTARDLPNYMAIEVTSEMLRVGLIEEPEESKPQNVCSRKLWERLVVNQSLGEG